MLKIWPRSRNSLHLCKIQLTLEVIENGLELPTKEPKSTSIVFCLSTYESLQEILAEHGPRVSLLAGSLDSMDGGDARHPSLFSLALDNYVR